MSPKLSFFAVGLPPVPLLAHRSPARGYGGGQHASPQRQISLRGLHSCYAYHTGHG
jgi:hypothetical protein